MNSTEVFALIGLITSLGYLGMTMSSRSIKNGNNTITTGGKYTKMRVYRSNRKTRK
jgi:hypothetical protein